MTPHLAPYIIQVATEPALGILGRVGDALVIERIVLAAAEAYGDCLTHGGGHYECWEAWRMLGDAKLRAAGLPREIGVSEYDDWPRERVVYEVLAPRFVLYLDRRLQQASLIVQIRQAFGLHGAEVQVRGDPHYRR